jgi:hypothetical protein
MSNYKTGDRVAALHDVIQGVILKVDKEEVIIEDEDGFERKYTVNEVVPISTEQNYRVGEEAFKEDDFLVQPRLKKRKNQKNKEFVDEIDLHIEMLTDDNSGMTNYEIVQVQMRACKQFVAKIIEQKKKKGVLIHGKGTGVLRQEILLFIKELNEDEQVQIECRDADYNRYGFGGATEVFIK